MEYFARRNLYNSRYYYYIHYYYIIPINEEKIINFDYFNFYSEFSGYINFIQINENSYPYKKSLTGNIINNIEQIEGKNEIKIELNSISFKNNKEIVKYYLLINFYLEYIIEYYSILNGNRKPNPINHEFLEIIEDIGINDIIYKEIKINVDLYNKTNEIFIIPLFKNTNLILDDYSERREFNYSNINVPKDKMKLLLYILIPSLIVVVIIIVIVVVIIVRKKKKKKYQ